MEVLANDLFSRSIAISAQAIYLVRKDTRAHYALPISGGEAGLLGLAPDYKSVNPALTRLGMTVSPADSHLIWGIQSGSESDLMMIRGCR